MDKKIKEKITKSVAVAASAAAIIGGGLTDDDDGLSELIQKELDGNDPEIEYVETSGPVKKIALENVAEEEKAPLWKSVIAAPVWAAAHLLGTLLEPILGKVITWLLIAAAIVLITALGIKKVFPDMPLKDILSKKTIGMSLAAAAILLIADMLLSAFCAGYIKWKNIFRLLLGLALVMAVIVHRCRKLGRRKPTELVLPM